MIFSEEMGFGFILREAKYIQKHTFQDFPTIFEFGQFFGLNFCIQCTPFGVNLYLEQPHLPGSQPVGLNFAYILPIPLSGPSIDIYELPGTIEKSPIIVSNVMLMHMNVTSHAY